MQDHANMVAFFEQLGLHPGGPWYHNGSCYEPDDQIVQLTEIDPHQRWSTPASFLDFLDRTGTRQLLRCFIGSNAQDKNRSWSFHALQQRTHLSGKDLEDALAFCDRQAFAVPEETRGCKETIFRYLRMLSLEPVSDSISKSVQGLEKAIH